jgi:putative endonuclease
MRREYFVYFLRCSDGTLYTGMTGDLERRLDEHSTGANPGCYTFERRPVELEHSVSFSYVWDAIEFETMVKKWSKEKKEAFIRGDTYGLKIASRKKFPKRYVRKCKRVIRTEIFLVRFRLCRKLLGMTWKEYFQCLVTIVLRTIYSAWRRVAPRSGA